MEWIEMDRLSSNKVPAVPRSMRRRIKKRSGVILHKVNRMLKFFLLTPFLVLTLAAQSPPEQKKDPKEKSPPPELTEEEKEILKDREILENLTLLENLDTIEFIDILNEMDPDWSESDESAIPVEKEKEGGKP